MHYLQTNCFPNFLGGVPLALYTLFCEQAAFQLRQPNFALMQNWKKIKFFWHACYPARQNNSSAFVVPKKVPSLPNFAENTSVFSPPQNLCRYGHFLGRGQWTQALDA